MTDRKCSIDGCSSAWIARGLCNKHWRRWRTNGDPLVTRRMPQGESFAWIKDVAVPYEGEECLTWPFGRHKHGYGDIQIDGSKKLAHRVVCELAHGKPPHEGSEAAHSCGNGHEGCVNPNHLRWDTRHGNMVDKVEHGTHARGTKSYNSRLTEQDVREIRSLAGSVPYRVLGERFGIAKNTARLIAVGKRWGWLDHG